MTAAVGWRTLRSTGGCAQLPSGIEASGTVVEGHEVVDFRVWFHGRQLPVPTWAYVAVAEAIPSGGPADPQRWDLDFGTLDGFTAGSEEELARQNKANELPPGLAALYREVRTMREGKQLEPKRLQELLETSKRFGDEPLLREELEELLARN